MLVDKSGEIMKIEQDRDDNGSSRLTIDLPEQPPDENVSVVVLDIEGDMKIDAEVKQRNPDE